MVRWVHVGGVCIGRETPIRNEIATRPTSTTSLQSTPPNSHSTPPSQLRYVTYRFTYLLRSILLQVKMKQLM